MLVSDRGLRWYQSSASAKRGFCRFCGSNLFWSPESDNYVAIMAGTLNQPTELEAVKHIFVLHKADYYALNDGLRQRQQGDQQTIMFGDD